LPVVARRANPFGEIRIVTNRRTGAISYCQGGWYQSRADRSGVSLMSYIHAIFGLLAELDARRVVVIGGAGGTLGSMLARIGKDVTIVDVDSHAFKVAHRYFNLDPAIACIIGDGRRFIERSKARFDAIVVDAYFRGTAPAHLCTMEFFARARRRLRPGGRILFNAIAGNDRDPHPDRIASGMIEAGLPVRILDTLGETHRNAIIVGGEGRRLRPPRLLMKPATMADDLADDLRGMAFRSPRPCDPITDEDYRAPRRKRRR
jgi:predicted membrane-bound spermidine synthase